VRYTDDAAKTPNVYEIDSRGRARRLTNFVGGGVRFLTASADGQTLAFEYEGRAYTMAPPGGEPKAVEFTAAMDDKFTNEERLVLTSGADEMALLPKGETVVFSVRSELWSVPVKKEKGPNADDARQLTAWAGLDEQPLAAPDGKTLFFVSDRDGARNLYKMDIESKKTTRITTGDRDVFRLSLTPDRKRLSFFLTGPQGGLYAMDLEGAPNPQLVFAEPGEGSVAYSWSPDGRWVAYADQLDRSGYYFWESGTNVWVYDTVEKRSYNVTKENSTNVQPSWSADGRYLYFRTFRASGGANVGALWVIPLQREDRRSDELQLKYEKPAAPVKVEIDFDRIEDRARRFIGQDPQSAVQSNPETGDLYFLSEGDLWRASYSGEDLRRLTAGGGIGDFSFNEDYKSVWFVKGGVPSVMDITKPNFPVTSVTFRADWVRDLRLERKAAFDQFWREYNRSFYDGNFHGRDWVATKRRYEPLLDSVGHRNEMATVLNMMVGELESSHSEVSSAPGNPGGSSSAHPGFSFDYTHTGPGLKVREVPQGAPGSYAATAVKPGEYVLEINGRPVRADEALFRDVLNDQSGREITLLVNDKPNAQGARAVKYRAVSGGEFGGLKRRNLLEARRAYVEEKSGGWLTYVHISGMGGGNFDQFQREFWQATEGKQGVINVRDNGGGNISDRLIDIIERRPHSYYVPRDEKPLLAPGQTWGLATVVMHAESSFSNAEMFPYAMKQRGLAATVGMPTPGYVIWTGGFRLVDGTGARMPGSGVYRMDGSPLENMGQVPDHQVQQSATDYFAGRDPQLDKAIEVALKAAK
jgi:tricorn protease